MSGGDGDGKEDCEFCMEVTQRTRADVVGGMLVQYDTPGGAGGSDVGSGGGGGGGGGRSSSGGREGERWGRGGGGGGGGERGGERGADRKRVSMRLIEGAQIPEDAKYRAELDNIKRYNHFNTNNLWVKLRAIQRVVEGRALRSEVIVNTLTIQGTKVIQLETAAGSAIQCFRNPMAINVHRQRFLPIKTCSDLMLIQSDVYSIVHGSLVMNKLRLNAMGYGDEEAEGGDGVVDYARATPIVKLGPHFDTVDEYNRRIRGGGSGVRSGFPSMLELDHLTVSGDVNFGRDVKLKGTVIIVANNGGTMDIPDGSVLENVVVTGSLNILQH